MKEAVNYLLRLYVKSGLFLYFSKIETSGTENIPIGKPIILVANHQNALIDPLLIATYTGLKPSFLTRANIFNHKVAAKLLHYIRMLPVYRFMDGLSGIKKNEETFGICHSILKNKKTILIFPEGDHNLHRRIRPLSKGFVRIVSGAMEKYPDLEPVILPVGINYSAHQYSGSKVQISFGTAIDAKLLLDDGKTLIRETESQLKQLCVHIDEADYDATVGSLKDNSIDLSSPVKVRDFLNRQNKKQDASSPKNPFFRNAVFKILHFPLFLIWLWVKSKIKDEAFYSTFKFLIGFLLLPLYYLIILGLTKLFGEMLYGWIIVILAFVSLITNRNPQK